jgi:hypothetical protein
MLTTEELTEFFDRLSGPEGCDFRKVNDEWSWSCQGRDDQSYAQKILRLMEIPPARAEPFLAECTEHGGHPRLLHPARSL